MRSAMTASGGMCAPNASEDGGLGNNAVKTIAQGPLKNLWRCNPNDLSEVQ